MVQLRQPPKSLKFVTPFFKQSVNVQHWSLALVFNLCGRPREALHPATAKGGSVLAHGSRGVRQGAR